MFSTAKLAISFGIAWHPALKTNGEGGGIKKSLRSITAWEGLLSSEVVCFFILFTY